MRLDLYVNLNVILEKRKKDRSLIFVIQDNQCKRTQNIFFKNMLRLLLMAI